MDLSPADLIAKTECYVLNQDQKYPWTNLFIGDERLQLRSDTDGKCLVLSRNAA